MFNSVIGGSNADSIKVLPVLKDASTAAIYGTRAANGVIVGHHEEERPIVLP